MKYSAIALALALVTSPNPSFVHGKEPIGLWDIKLAGAEVVEVSPSFRVKMYYEVHKDAPDIKTGFFVAGDTDKPCADGTPASVTTANAEAKYAGITLNTTASDSVIKGKQFSVFDVQSTDAWIVEPNNTASIKACATGRLEAEGIGVISQIDNHVELDVDLISDFHNFSTPRIWLNTTGVNDGFEVLRQNATTAIGLRAWTCGNGTAPPSKYKVGQKFSVCVWPTQRYMDLGYLIESFESVTCKNAAVTRPLIQNSVPDALTVIEKNASGYLKTGGYGVGPATSAFTSYVIASYFGSYDKSFTCNGRALLTHKNFTKSERRLEAPFSYSSISGISESSSLVRALQDAGPDESEPFELTIELSREQENELSAIATAPATTVFGWTGLFVGVVGAVAMGMISM